jgi:hypothetical protein
MRAVLDSFKEELPRAEPVPAPVHNLREDLLNQYTITDARFGFGSRIANLPALRLGEASAAGARIRGARKSPRGSEGSRASRARSAGGVPRRPRPLAVLARLRAYLAAAFGADWSDALERRLIAEADEILDKRAVRDGSLDIWLRDRAFRQHSALFNQRPCLWHIWDGLKDGFSVFVHYHRFDQASLSKLTYTMIGDWLARAKAENNALRFEKGRELQQSWRRA